MSGPTRSMAADAAHLAGLGAGPSGSASGHRAHRRLRAEQGRAASGALDDRAPGLGAAQVLVEARHDLREWAGIQDWPTRRAALLWHGKSLWCRHCFASQIVAAEAETAITRVRPRKTRGPRSPILPLRTFRFFRQTAGSKARGLDADGKLLSLGFLHRQRRISRTLLLCSRRGSLLGILPRWYHRCRLTPAAPFWVRHCAKKNPAAVGPDTGS